MNQVFSVGRSFMGLAVLLTLTLTACGQSEAPDCGGLEVKQPWVRVAPDGADVMAAYFSLHNTGDSKVIVNGVSSSQFDRAQMHETIVNDNGQASMQPLHKVAIDAGDTVVFKSGGRHVMLFQPSQTYAAGDQVEVILACGSQQAELPVAAVVRSAEPSATPRQSAARSGPEQAETDASETGHDSAQTPDADNASAQ